MSKPTYAPLTAWKVTYEDGEVIKTNAASGITQKKAEEYWGQSTWPGTPKMVKVEMLSGPRPWVGLC